MGFSNFQIFKRILLPSARPGIFAGLSLVAMECVSDFGTVAFFNVQSLTTAIYDSWIIFDDINTAYQLSFFLIFFLETNIIKLAKNIRNKLGAAVNSNIS